MVIIVYSIPIYEFAQILAPLSLANCRLRIRGQLHKKIVFQIHYVTLGHIGVLRTYSVVLMRKFPVLHMVGNMITEPRLGFPIPLSVAFLTINFYNALVQESTTHFC
ncbi:hypothetical protein IFM47457_06479 [Aspergillus lentulus]|nr:hypothetical protein IFM47457_06479 [Aspergillus lentulus]